MPSQGQATTTANPQTTWGNSDTRNNQSYIAGNSTHYPIINISTGTIDVYRNTRTIDDFSLQPIYVQTHIGSIPRGGTFNVLSESDGTPIANADEITHFGSINGRSQMRQQALTVAREGSNQWDGVTTPGPNAVIYGPNSANRAYNYTGNNRSNAVTDDNGGSTQQNPVNDAATGADNQTSTPFVGGALRSSQPHTNRSNTSLGQGQVIVYPQTLRSAAGSRGQDFIKLQMLEYSPKGVADFSGGNLSGTGPRPKDRKALGSVVLPIPGGISDNNAVSWGDGTMNPIDQAFAGLAYSALTEGGEAMGSRAIQVLENLKNNSGEIGNAAGIAIAAYATQQGGQMMQRTMGAILNPNMELLFNNPTLRQFNFTWKLAPRSRQEAQDVIRILRFFKQGMVPIRESPNLFLKSPNTWKVSYHHQMEEHNFLNKFKECALLSCGVQYTPDGNYATFEDGVMTAYQLTMAFQELEPIYSDDYNNMDIRGGINIGANTSNSTYGGLLSAGRSTTGLGY